MAPFGISRPNCATSAHSAPRLAARARNDQPPAFLRNRRRGRPGPGRQSRRSATFARAPSPGAPGGGTRSRSRAPETLPSRPARMRSACRTLRTARGGEPGVIRLARLERRRLSLSPSRRPRRNHLRPGPACRPAPRSRHCAARTRMSAGPERTSESRCSSRRLLPTAARPESAARIGKTGCPPDRAKASTSARGAASKPRPRFHSRDNPARERDRARSGRRAVVDAAEARQALQPMRSHTRRAVSPRRDTHARTTAGPTKSKTNQQPEITPPPRAATTPRYFLASTV